ncbi:MAG TPA: hypothetical protein VN193_17320 [Candidatus Angelobacter sp.]|nr:hypothetical protein [Candidatus Angelobacter sp.]
MSPAPPLGIVLGNWTSGSTYSVALVDTGGHKVASTTAQVASEYVGSATPGETATLPVSWSASRLYYLDGDSNVKYLAPDGQTGTAATVPGSRTERVAFAVSPDDSRIAVAVMTWANQSTFTEQLYDDDLTGGHRVELAIVSASFSRDANGGTWSSDMEWPIGWRAGKIVVGLSLPRQQFPPSPVPPDAQGGYKLMDASNGSTAGSVCAGGDGVSLPQPAGVLCLPGGMPNGHLQVRDWTDGVSRDLGAALCLSPSALSAHGVDAVPETAASAGGCHDTGRIDIVQGSSTTPSVSGTAVGWIDDGTLVFTSGGSPPSASLSVATIASGQTASVGPGTFVGALPGGL